MAAGIARRLADAHCHIQDIRLWDGWKDVLLRAKSAGVDIIGVNATSSGDYERVEELSRHGIEGLEVCVSYGLHPYCAKSGAVDGWLEEVRRRLEDDKSACLGECGLDKSKKGLEYCAWEEQVDVCRKQLQLARELDRNVSVHCVRAFGPMLDLIREERPPTVLLHSWGGAPDLIPALVDLNCIFSFSAAILNPAMKKARASASAVPLDALVIETDSPDQAPRSKDHKVAPTNEPSNLPLILEELSKLRSESIDELAEATYQNTKKFYNLV